MRRRRRRRRCYTLPVSPTSQRDLYAEYIQEATADAAQVSWARWWWSLNYYYAQPFHYYSLLLLRFFVFDGVYRVLSQPRI